MRFKTTQARAKVSTYNAERHTCDFMISTEDVDRDGEILEASGARLPESVPITDTHDTRSIQSILGRWENIRKVKTKAGKGIGATARFSQVNPLGKLAEDMVAHGDINSASVGFLPHGWTDPDGAKGEWKPGGQIPYPLSGRHYTDWEIVEAAICAVPSNTEALVRAKAAGIIIPSLETRGKPGLELIGENYHYRLRDPNDFEKDNFRTITMQEKRTIKMVVGKLKGETKTTKLALLFPADEWTREAVQSWIADHEDSLKSVLGDLERRMPFQMAVLKRLKRLEAKIDTALGKRDAEIVEPKPVSLDVEGDDGTEDPVRLM